MTKNTNNTNTTITLNNHARTSATIYAEALLEACELTRVKDPVAALVDSDDYPRLRKIPDVEYAIGWLHGCAEAHGVTVEVLWAHLDQLNGKRFSRAVAPHTPTSAKRAVNARAEHSDRGHRVRKVA